MNETVLLLQKIEAKKKIRFFAKIHERTVFSIDSSFIAPIMELKFYWI